VRSELGARLDDKHQLRYPCPAHATEVRTFWQHVGAQYKTRACQTKHAWVVSKHALGAGHYPASEPERRRETSPVSLAAGPARKQLAQRMVQEAHHYLSSGA